MYVIHMAAEEVMEFQFIQVAENLQQQVVPTHFNSNLKQNFSKFNA